MTIQKIVVGGPTSSQYGRQKWQALAYRSHLSTVLIDFSHRYQISIVVRFYGIQNKFCIYGSTNRFSSNHQVRLISDESWWDYYHLGSNDHTIRTCSYIVKSGFIRNRSFIIKTHS